MAKRVLSIEVGLRFTRICELTGHKVAPVVHQCITFATPQGVFEDGYIRDKATLGNLIHQQLMEKKIRTTDAIFTINSTKIANREVTIPYVKESKIKSIIELQASDYFPIDISEYNISYYLLNGNFDKKKIIAQTLNHVNLHKGESKEKKEKQESKDIQRKMKLLLLAAPNNLIQSYYNLATAAGLRIESIDYIGNSFYQLAKKQIHEGVNISIHMNENTSLINIIENENLLLQRIIPYGSQDVIEKVKSYQVFQADTDEEAISLLSREKLIHHQFEVQKSDTISYISTSESYDQAMREMKAKEDVTESLKFLVNNVIRVVDYFTSKNTEKKIGYVYVSGLGAKFQGLLQLLKNELGYEVRRIEDLYAASFSKNVSIEKEEQADYIACIGAWVAPVGFGVKKKGNEVSKKTDLKAWKKGFVFASVVSVAFIGTMFVVRTIEVSKQKELNREINRLKPIELVYEAYEESVAKFNNLNTMHGMTESKVDKLTIILADLEERLPSSMTVKDMIVDSTGFTATIETDTQISIAKVLMNLGDIPYFSNLNINSYESTSSEGSAGIPTYSFRLQAMFSNQEIGAEVVSSENEVKDDTSEMVE